MPKRDFVRNLAALDRAEPYDVCVIGSGPAGTILATRLAEQGVRTVIIESGNSLLDWLADPRLKELAAYEVSGDANYPLTRTTSRIVGGNSNFWTGRSERFHPTDFEPHSYSPGGEGWPVKYDELEPYYYRAEQVLRVRGGKLSEFAPPRRQDLPLPPRPDIWALKERMAKAGVTLDDSPTATPTKAFRFFRAHKEILPRFLNSAYGTLVSGVTVTRLIHDDDGNIVGAKARTLDGEERVARARAFVVCCGGMQTPRLLLLSRSDRFPNGIGNNHDRVGRGFNEHPSLNFYGKIQHDRSTLALHHSIGRTHQFYERFRDKGLGAIHAVVIQSWVFPNHLLRYRLRDMPRHAFKILSRLVRPTLYMSPTLEQRPCDDNRVTLSASKVDPLGDPIAHLHLSFSQEDRRLIEKARALSRATLEKAGATDLEEIELTWSRHHLGSCRMGDSPTTSVVDRNLRVHDYRNLYLCGSEVFVTGAAIQPVLTISAFALRLGDHLGRTIRQTAPALELDTAGLS
ncbi:MAG: GMC family oxidoreductase [Gemmatimonadota bacterium]|nr:MAG: GMC family oxidoreductase [Gemmatimonadota bacterium]